MVDHIGDRCRRQPGGETGQPGVTEFADGLDLLGVKAKQGFSIDQSGKLELDPAVKTPFSQQRRVHGIWKIGRPDHNHTA